MKVFQSQSCALTTRFQDAARAGAAIGLRRNHITDRQREFDSVHHHFVTTNESRRDVVTRIEQSLRGILERRKNNLGRGKELVLLKNLYDFDDAMDELLSVYYDDYLSVFLLRLDLISPTELRQRSINANKYWLTYWQRQGENDKRFDNIEGYRQNIRKARNQYRSEKWTLKRKTEEHLPLDRARELL